MRCGQQTRPVPFGLKLPWAVNSEGTRRSDSHIRRDVVDALGRCPSLKEDTIDVAVTDGEVRLSGKVKYWDNRRLAGDAAWSVSGVRDVSNSLLVEKL